MNAVILTKRSIPNFFFIPLRYQLVFLYPYIWITFLSFSMVVFKLTVLHGVIVH